MFIRSFLLAALLLLATTTPRAFSAEKLDFDRMTPALADQPIPVQDFFRPPLFSNPILNAGGTHFAALVDIGNDQVSLLICDIAKKQLKTVKGYKDVDVDWFSWLDDAHLLSSMIEEKRYAKGLFVANINGDRGGAVEQYSATALVGVPLRAPMKPLVWVYRNAYDDGKNLGVIQIDATKRLGENAHALPGSMQFGASNEEVTLHGTQAKVVNSFPNPPGTGVVIDYLSDKDGELAFAITAEQGVETLFRYTGKKWERSPVNLDDYYPMDVGDQTDEIIVLGPALEGKPRALHRLNAATGELGALLAGDKSYTITSGNFYRHPVTRTILGVKYYRSALHSTWLDPNYAAVQKMLATRFPGIVVNLLGGNSTEDHFFFSTYSDRQPVTYYSLDLKAKTVGLIASSAPWIDPTRMRPTNAIKINTRDGLQIEAYLTLPDGASKSNPPPVVVLCHGGPHARDTWGYDGEVQFLASRGYAVLQPNYRGSTGYNWMFPAGDSWNYRKMHEDVTDAALMLGKAGLVDSKRMAIMGSSFGGYLALCGAAFESDTYRCAITIAGVFDWAQVLNAKKSVRYESAAYGIFLRNLGDPTANHELFDSISPLRHVDKVKIPVFVAHGREDAVADVRESRALIAQLEKHQIPHQSLLVAREGHGMSYAKNQVELYSRIEAFLAKNLAPAK
jgi:dienelactone hydrolase